MQILVTGNNGYIGTVLTEILYNQNFDVVGLDNNYFEQCNLTKVNNLSNQIIKDIRDVSIEDVKNIDGIIHLAALSNDHLGELMPSLTEDINYKSTIKLANLAKEAGVKRFIYVSSQSMYGQSDTRNELDEENSQKKPLTSYASTKWKSEINLRKIINDKFTVVCFRPSTVFGFSPRLRCDIVFNYFIACAYTTGKIEIFSDGTPWRPVIHVRDVCEAFIAGLKASKEIVSGKSYNVGIANGNYTIKELAQAANKAVPGSDLIFLNKHIDSRTYKVSFKKILFELKDYYYPKWNLQDGAKELVDYFNKIDFTENDFRGEKCIRLTKLKNLIKTKKISNELKWL